MCSKGLLFIVYGPGVHRVVRHFGSALRLPFHIVAIVTLFDRCHKKAKAAHMDSIALTYGYNCGEDISLHQPECVLSNFEEIVGVL